MATVEEAAQWLYDQVLAANAKGQPAYQETLVLDVTRVLGGGLTHFNENGNHAFNRDVLRAFGKLHGGTIGWDRSEFGWYVKSAKN